ncbi:MULTISPECIES: hypothetical protein [Bacillaceae]|uniref:Uncharacterized protein n=1 Tax=Cytobacillus firmus TaxID=1399 RepID=A0AA46Q0H3_CYTFI|nr:MULTISPECIES: hypothetical protein [Bacillaceae]MCC3645144.1 hypothetical protein [Cytobacillus oceanisediminis]UYG96970.1 hypothetical protein OD459_08050 [Cytobacillus firmus]WHY35327.1 hypothetical protein QNH44_06180 [Cytobacillus firmus]
MNKKFLLFVSFCFILIGAAISVNAESAPRGKSPAQEQIHEHHHRMIDESLMKSLLEQGFTKREIFIAAHIAKFSNKQVAEVLTFYKKNNSSWEKTAQQYGVDLDKIKKHHHHLDKFLEANKGVVLQKVSEYSGKSAQVLQGYLDKGVPLRFLVSGAAMAKAANKDLGEIIQLREQGKSLHEIKTELNVDKEQIHAEMKKLVDEIHKEISKAK